MGDKRLVFLFCLIVFIIGLIATSTQNPTIKTTDAASQPTPQTRPEASNLDGSLKLVLENNTLTVVEKNGNKITLPTGDLSSSSTISLSFNSWSPKDEYVFVKLANSGGTDFLVFKASGIAFGENENFLAVTALFDKNHSDLKIKDITGWDADNLLHVLTIHEDNSKGPNFWFDVPSRSFIQLY